MKFVAIDIETSGLYPIPGSKIFCVAVNNGTTIKVVEKIESIRGILENEKICKIIHNAHFDSFWLRRLYDIKIKNIWDTRLVEQVILGENLPRSNKNEELKEQLSSSLLYTLKRYKLANLKNKEMGAEFATRDKNAPLTPKEIEYAKNDVKYLLELQKRQEKKLLELDLVRVAELENKVVEVVVEMRNRGIGFSKTKWLEIAKNNETEFNRLQSKMPKEVSNWNSPAQVKTFFASKNIHIASLTEIDEISDKYNHPILNQFIEMRKMFKDVTTYGKSWLEDKIKIDTVDSDNRVRADFEQIINTGRFSCSHPNLQQLRRDGLQRSAFIPSKGNVFVIGDFSSQEIGIAAAASGETLWINAMLNKEDVHSLTAAAVSNQDWVNGKEKNCAYPKKCKCPKHVDQREDAKVTNFTILYGGGPLNVSRKTKKSLKEATKLVHRFKRAVPKLIRWLTKNANESIRTRLSYSADPFKRRRTLRDPEDWMLSNIGKNNPIQSCGANMIKLAMANLPETLPIVLTVHDELIIEVPKAKANKAALQLKSVMEKAADYCTGVPGLIIVEPRIADSLLKTK